MKISDDHCFKLAVDTYNAHEGEEGRNNPFRIMLLEDLKPFLLKFAKEVALIESSTSMDNQY